MAAPVSNRSPTSSQAVDGEASEQEPKGAVAPLALVPPSSSVEPYSEEWYGASGHAPERHEPESPWAPVRASAAAEAPLSLDDQLVDLGDQAARHALCFKTSQHNEVSIAARNEGDICGGTSTAGALVLASDTKEHARANAEAMRTLFAAQGTLQKLPEGVDPAAVATALGHLEQGTLSKRDLFNLQQAIYVTARTYDGGASGNKPGVDVGQLGALVADLKARGASLGQTELVCVKLDARTAHVIARTPEGIVNTGGSTIPKAWLSPASPHWDGDVKAGEDVQVRARQVGQRVAAPGHGFIARLARRDPNDVKALFDRRGTLDEQLRRQAEAFDPKKAPLLR